MTLSRSRQPATSNSVTDLADERRAGRVTHDARGNATWDWDIATGVLARKTVAELITTLESPVNLSVDHDGGHSGEWAGDPYNRTLR